MIKKSGLMILCLKQNTTTYGTHSQRFVRSGLRHLSWVAAFLWASSALTADPIWVAEGLQIQQIADDDLVSDCTTVTTDPNGRIVASGPGYIRTLLPSADGVVTKELVTGIRHGAHGLCFRDNDLYYTADNGIWRVRDTDGDSFVDSNPEQILEIKTGGEHDAHALRVGPDGYWYLICGNGTRGMFDLQNVQSPAVPRPRAGVIWRISPDWTQREVWADGFRNAYDFDFAPNGQIDTYDSDGERDVSLPWYRPTRVFRVASGDDAGWVTRSWKRPNYDPGMPHVLAELGRGSPTGVTRYRNTRLPKRFHGGVFVLDWTFGRMVFVSDRGDAEVVARPSDTAGFAVTDITETADGKLIVSVGGRRSRGGLYVIDATNPNPSVSSGNSKLDWSNESDDFSNPMRAEIVRLRQRASPAIDHDAVRSTIARLGVTKDEQELLVVIAYLIDSLGGLGPGDPKDARGKQQVAAVFDGYRGVIRPQIDNRHIEKASNALCKILADEGASSRLRHECIRALAVIEPTGVWQSVVDDLKRCSSPVEKLHRLIALARLPDRRSDQMTEDVVDAMLAIPVEVANQELSVDRNWSARLGELFVALRRRDSLMPSRLVTNPGFGHAAHLVWTHRMNEEGLEIARRKYLLESDSTIDPEVARFIATGNDAVPRKYIRGWLENPSAREAAWLALANHPQESDVDELNKAALSLNKQVRESAARALKQLGKAPPTRSAGSASIQQWIDKGDDIAAIDADASMGKQLFQTRQCAKCHNAAKALGPSLSGVSKRFATKDLLRATVDPSHTIPDRYIAQQVVTNDGKVIVGMKVYQSVDGITLLTADAQTLRINSDQMESIQPSNVSLMPSGLLDGLSNEQVASLIKYLQEL